MDTSMPSCQDLVDLAMKGAARGFVERFEAHRNPPNPLTQEWIDEHQALGLESIGLSFIDARMRRR